MAGGIGSRFWPLSRKGSPKQFLDIVGSGRSMIQETFDRLDTFVPVENLLVMTGETFRKQMLNELPALHPTQILTEPQRRNTAPAIAYAAYKIATVNPEAMMIVSPADHYIGNVSAYRRTLIEAVHYARKENCLMTIGIEPTFPATGYGYIELTDQALADGIGPIALFKEKPDEAEAKRLLATGRYLWNSGIFVWQVKDIITALEEHLPEVAVHFAEIQAYGQNNETEVVAEAFMACPSISIDYGVMEKADNVCTVKADFEWDDLGTWQSLQRFREIHPMESDTDTNCRQGRLILEDSPETMVHMGVKGKDVVVVGLEDYLVVDLEDTLLIAPKNDQQRLHQLMDKYAKQLNK
ncbi:MAG: mannose-1-phosphate guanylyltransferase [Porphyromonas sp.]|nr:mannose-1-phosphate guanylyltransferase [Porphyromonas sp.]